MYIKLFFTVENNKSPKDLCFTCETENNIADELSAALNNLWPGKKLPSTGTLSFYPTEKGIELRSKKPLTINGVSKTNRILKPGDRIIFGDLRIFFDSFRQNKPDIDNEKAAPDKPVQIQKIIKILPAAALIIAAGTASIIAGCMTPPESAVVEIIREPAPEEKPSAGETEIPAEKTPAEKSETAAGTQVVNPGTAIPYFDLDILFIHAHPDDESLDFGTLLAAADSAGLKTGLVVFTDGESGIDLYPDRPVTGFYPDYYMEGSELAEVRKNEQLSAAELLGVDLLIRFGLKNHPYNSQADVLSTDDIIENWGGEDKLLSMLADIVLKTRPETIAAPEGPGRALEHFEHETVGYLIAKLMNSYNLQDTAMPVRFITSIDPRQHQLYPEASGINAGDRKKQLSALAMHKTQNDAINIGTDFLPEYPFEYYKIQFWNAQQSWDEWAAALRG